MPSASRCSAARDLAPTVARSAWVAPASEIPARLRRIGELHVRYARWDFSRVDLVDPRTGVVLCPIKPLDKAANANGQRRRLNPVGQDLSPLPTGLAAPLAAQLLAEYAATGMPPAYLPAAEDHAGHRALGLRRAHPCTPPGPIRMNQRLLALYGLKWNPFSPELPTEAIYVPSRLENFCWRIEHAQIREVASR